MRHTRIISDSGDSSQNNTQYNIKKEKNKTNNNNNHPHTTKKTSVNHQLQPILLVLV
jgi:hypothetical protein